MVGYLQRLEIDRIVGWIGSSDAGKIDMEIFSNNILLSSFSIDPLDSAFQEERNGVPGSWFEIVFSTELLLEEALENEEFSFRIRANGEWLEQEHSVYLFDVREWLKNINRYVTKEHFLYLLPLLGSEKTIEKNLSIENLSNAILWMKEYGLFEKQKEKSNALLHELIGKNITSDLEIQTIEGLLASNEDILNFFIENIGEIDDLQMIRSVKSILKSMQPNKAWQIVSSCSEKEGQCIGKESIRKRAAEEEHIFDLLNGKVDILESWDKLLPGQRIKNAFLYLSIFAMRRDYAGMARLNLTLEEIRKITGKREAIAPEELTEALFESGEAWNGLMLILYFASAGIDYYHFISLCDQFLKYSSHFDKLDMPALKWLIVEKLFVDNNNSYTHIRKFINYYKEVVDEKSQWYDENTKKIFYAYFDVLMRNDIWEFVEHYKYCMNHYLLDQDFILDDRLLNERYWDRVTLDWLRSIEANRSKAIELLDRKGSHRTLVGYLDTLVYLSPVTVEKVKYELLKSKLNLQKESEVSEEDDLAMLAVGGEYDRMLAAQEIGNHTIEKHHESQVIDRMNKWKTRSPNNYWYRRALRLRASSSGDPLTFFEELYKEIDDRSSGENKLRLIRLFLSELLWYMKKGLLSDTIEIMGLTFENLLVELSLQEPDARFHIDLFKLHRELEKYGEETESLPKEILVEAIDDLETVLLTEKIIKSTGQSFIPVKSAIQHLEERLLFPYTLVMIYSCQAYIPTRQKIIRETWLTRAKKMGISYRFVVGGADSSHTEEDMLYLDVEDTYESLPQKTVEMFRFASESFSFERYMKIDDDCFLNLDAYFADDALFESDYYGRYLHRNIGDTDRVWHQKKSKSNWARNSIDLSPEPSYYADGSTGYVLSENACASLVKAYDAPENRMLISHSFMEDKLVGDLLVPQGYRIESSNFTAVIYRKLTPEIEATFWEYNLLPKPDNDVKILHCETEAMLRKAWDHYQKPTTSNRQNRYFSNRKIDDFTGAFSKQPFLEEIRIDRDALLRAKHVAVTVCKNEAIYLPALLEHHRNIGIDHFIYIDNGSQDESLEYMLAQEDVSVLVSTQQYRNFRFSVDWLEAVFANFCYGKWVLVVDADEFFIYDGYEKNEISLLSEYAERNGYDAFLAPMIDMYNRNELSVADIRGKNPLQVCNFFDDISTMDIAKESLHGPFSNAPIYAGGVRARIFGKYNPAPAYSYLNQKYCFFKYLPTHRFIEGLHFMGNIHIAPTRAGLLHFKFHSGFYKKVIEQIEGGQHWNGSEEYKRYLKKLELDRNISFFDKNISRKFYGSASLIEAGYIDRIKV